MTNKPDHQWIMSCDNGTRAIFTCPADMSEDAAEHVIDSLRLIIKQLERRLAKSRESTRIPTAEQLAGEGSDGC